MKEEHGKKDGKTRNGAQDGTPKDGKRPTRPNKMRNGKAAAGKRKGKTGATEAAKIARDLRSDHVFAKEFHTKGRRQMLNH